MPNGAAARRASDPEDLEQKDESMTPLTVANDQRTDDMREEASAPSQQVVAHVSESERASLMPISGTEMFLRALPTVACMAIVLVALAVRPGVFWGTVSLAVLVVLTVFSFIVLTPKTRSR